MTTDNPSRATVATTLAEAQCLVNQAAVLGEIRYG